MTGTSVVIKSQMERRVVRLQWVTLGWMGVECSAALFAAARARSVSLLAFGSDSFIELISATVVLLQFYRSIQVSQDRAAKFCGSLLYILAGVVACVSLAGFISHAQADGSQIGVAVTIGALLLMPVLARMKRKEANRTGNKALRADAVQSATCAYLAALTLTGLVLRRTFGIGVARSSHCTRSCTHPRRRSKEKRERAEFAVAASCGFESDAYQPSLMSASGDNASLFGTFSLKIGVFCVVYWIVTGCPNPDQMKSRLLEKGAFRRTSKAHAV